MSKTYTSLLVVLLAGAQTIRAQESLDNINAMLDSVEGTEQTAPAVAPASVEAAQPAAVSSAPAPVAEVASADLMEIGIQFFEAGEYDKAEEAFESALAQDAFNRQAMKWLNKTANKIKTNASILHKANRAQAMSSVAVAWNKELVPLAPVTDAENDEMSGNDMAVKAMNARLQGIMIPNLDFQDANIKDVMLFLSETARRQDPAKTGVNIVLMGMDELSPAGDTSVTISIRNMSLYEALQYIVEMASLKFEVQAKAVAVMPVNYVAPSELKLVSYTVIPEVGEKLEEMAGGGGVDDLFGDSADAGAAGPTDVKGFFSIVNWPEGSSAIYQPDFRKLFVKNTKVNLKAVEDVLGDLEDQAIRQRSQQVEIEAKFVEYTEGALEELGFDWTLYDDGTVASMGLETDGTYYQKSQGYAGTVPVNATGYTYADSEPTGYGVLNTTPTTGYSQIVDSPGQSLFGQGQRSNGSVFETVQSGVLSSMGGTPAAMVLQNTSSFPFDLAITAMEQEGTADVLSAPRVTTKSGNEAIIRVSEVHRYPQDYDVETGQRTAPVVKPQDWEDYDLGVTLKVLPVVDAEAATIDLDLQPEIKKFKGYDDYIVGYNSYETTGDSATVLAPAGDGSTLLARMPYFETRLVQTQVTIADGSTVVMGGLVDEQTETFRDQVPFLGDIPYLGRLFRTEGSRTSKKNLVITVKATQVDERGMTRDQRERANEMAAK